MNVEQKQLWPTTIFNLKLENLDNDKIKSEVLKRETKGQGFQFNPVQGGGWQSNKSLLGGLDSYASNLEPLRKSIVESVNKILSKLCWVPHRTACRNKVPGNVPRERMGPIGYFYY